VIEKRDGINISDSHLIFQAINKLFLTSDEPGGHYLLSNEAIYDRT
jgi:hypothetical protein